jgi:galactose mutarotase-like enzyme
LAFEILRLAHGEVSAEVVPERGALVSALRVGGTEILYLDRATLEDPTKNVRGGIPVLFPYAGKLVNETLVATGTKMKQHGFGRNKPWAVREQRPDFLRLALVQDADTRAQYPYDYEAEYTVSLLAHGLHVELMVQNKDSRPLPVSPGWHPYFRLPQQIGGDRAAAIIEVPASRQWALEGTLVPTGETIPVSADRDFRHARALGETYLDDVYTGVDRSGGSSACSLTDPTTGLTVRVVAGPTFREWVVYAPPSRPTICFEPYTCPPDAFNLTERGIVAGVIVLKPGEKWSDWIEVGIGSVDPTAPN